jgi:hypothetical protein
MTQKQLTLTTIINEIEGLYLAESYGTLFVVLDIRNSIKIALTEGRVVDISYNNEKSTAALKNIALFKPSNYLSFKFIPRKNLKNPKEDYALPSTKSILRMLNESKKNNKLSSMNLSSSFNLLQVTDMVASELAEYLGPMALIICEEHFETTSNITDIINMLDSISSEIDDSLEEEKFIQTVTGKLKNFNS